MHNCGVERRERKFSSAWGPGIVKCFQSSNSASKCSVKSFRLQCRSAWAPIPPNPWVERIAQWLRGQFKSAFGMCQRELVGCKNRSAELSEHVWIFWHLLNDIINSKFTLNKPTNYESRFGGTLTLFVIESVQKRPQSQQTSCLLRHINVFGHLISTHPSNLTQAVDVRFYTLSWKKNSSDSIHA